MSNSRELRTQINKLYDQLLLDEGSNAKFDAVDTITDLITKVSKPENNSSHITFVMEFANRIDSVGMTAKKSGVLDTFKSNVSSKLQMINMMF